MVFAAGLLHRLPPPSDKPLKPLKHVNCMIKHPCKCCWLTFFIAIVTSFIGFRILVSNSGPLGPFKVGVDYPTFEPIAKNADALVLAQEESAIALLGSPRASSRRGGFGRRLAQFEQDRALAANNPSHLPGATDLMLSYAERMLTREDGMPEDPLLSNIKDYNKRRRASTADALKQDQQSVSLATAILAVKARPGVENLYDDAGIEQLCRFRKGLMDDEPTWKDYCLLVDDPTHEGSGEANQICSRGSDVMSMFYGDSDYDIDKIDLEVFNTENFEDIVKIYSKRPLDFMKLMDYPADARTKVGELYGKLFGYLINDWQDTQYACNPDYKKDVTKVMKLLAHVKESPALESITGVINQYFDSGFNVSNPVTKHAKGFYSYGAPLKGWDNYVEQTAKDEQDANYARWWTTTKMRDLYPEGKKGEELWPTGIPSLLNTQLLLSEILLVLVGDGLKAILPCFLVTLIVWLQTGSLLIAVVTITEILLSISTAIFVTSAIFQIKWLSFQVFLALYIVLAIGADDVFVFMDAYKQSFYKGAEVNQSLLHRMSWVYRRAGLAMLITSLTTCSAFIASSVSSPIPELQNFGIFAACVIAIDYILVMTFLCANSILFHNWFEMKPGLCCACCDDCLVKKDAWKCSKGGCTALCAFDKAHTIDLRSTGVAAAGKAEETAKSRGVRFFEDEFPFNVVVKKLSTRLVSMAVCVIFLIAMLVSAGNIKPQTDTEQFLPDNHPFQRNADVNNEFDASNSDSTVAINFVWGFKEDDPIDQTGVNLIFDADNKGKPKYASGFKFGEPEQWALLDVCNELDAAEATKIKIDVISGNATKMTNCFIRGFEEYRKHKGKSFPVPDAADAAKALEEWLEDKDDDEDNKLPAAARPGPYESDIGWTKGEAEGELKLTWVKVRASSKLGTRQFLPATQLREYYNTWEAVLAKANARTGKTNLGNAFQLSGASTGRGNKWIFMTVQEAYIRMALVGAGVGLGIATIVLLLATRNLVITLTCVATIAAALGCVIGTIVAMGWQLGQNESLCIMVLTGFAVDYVVHLSHAYMESPALTRLERVHDALRDLGISVFWGMLTSMFAATTLATCQIQFLSKFGIFFALTIAYAYLWSVLFLMPLLACIGPEPPAADPLDAIGAIRPTPPSPKLSEDNIQMSSAPPSPPGSEIAEDEHMRVVGQVGKRTQTAPYVV